MKDEQSLACYSNLKIFQITAAYLQSTKQIAEFTKCLHSLEYCESVISDCFYVL